MLPLASSIQLEKLNLALVHPTVFILSFFNLEMRAHLSGPGETEPLLQAAEAGMLRVAQQTCVIQLHQDMHAGMITACVEPRNLVEVRRTGCFRYDVTLKLDILSLIFKQHRLCQNAKVVLCVIRRGKKVKLPNYSGCKVT